MQRWNSWWVLMGTLHHFQLSEVSDWHSDHCLHHNRWFGPSWWCNSSLLFSLHCSEHMMWRILVNPQVAYDRVYQPYRHGLWIVIVIAVGIEVVYVRVEVFQLWQASDGGGSMPRKVHPNANPCFRYITTRHFPNGISILNLDEWLNLSTKDNGALKIFEFSIPMSHLLTSWLLTESKYIKGVSEPESQT